MVFIYNVVIRVYYFGIWLASFFHKKARLWITGRRDSFEILEKRMAGRPSNERWVWMHCASLGEFEQGRTLIDDLKSRRPGIKILLTFFSPSGYEIRKNYEKADCVCYLPFDGSYNARRFLELTRPDVAIFVKYEFWYHYLHTLKQRGVPTFLVAAVFRDGQPFFRWYGHLHRRMLACFTQIFVQDESSVRLLSTATAAPRVVLAGDTRVDRVLDIAQQPKEFPVFGTFCGGSPVLVCGSTWPTDEAVIFEAMRSEVFKNWKIIMAPHDVRPERLQWIEKNAPFATVRFSQAIHQGEEQLRQASLLLVDNVGMLAWVYRFGRAAFIGGGFGKGIHNTLEPLAFGLPVLFGPRYRKFREADYLVRSGGGFCVRNAADMRAVMQDLSDPVFYEKTARTARQYLHDNSGATKRVVVELLHFLPV